MAINYEILETTAVATSILQFLSGVLICRKWIKNKSTGDSSGFPYLVGFLSTSLWMRYGILASEDGVAFVNLIGASLFLLYILVYYIFTVNKSVFVKQFALVLLLIFFIWTNNLSNPTQRVRLIGLICCIVTVCFFAAPLTMIFHVIRMKNSESLPFPLIVMSFITCILWLIYGILISDTFIQIPNFLGCILSMLQLLLFVCYPPKSYSGHGYKLVDQA